MTQRSSKRRPMSEIVKLSRDEEAFIQGLLIHEDADILVFNKPAGLAVQGGSGVTQDVDRLLWAFANRKGRRPKLVHRLDRDTSGVLVVAKTTPVAAHLSAQFADRSTNKVYYALVSGALRPESGTVDVPLQRFVSAGIDLVRPCTPADQGALNARTAWRVTASNETASLVEVTPETGRMHQIRAHLAYLGHPIAGDPKYGGQFSLGAIMIPKLLLHAQSLSVVHPGTAERMTFHAPFPEPFTGVLVELGLVSRP